MDMYNRKFRWSGNYDIVYCMYGTDFLRANKMKARLLQTYTAMTYFHDGVDLKYYWVSSPPCGGLQDVAWHIRTDN
eukprot:12887815-Prorocentrum_lima.AAC.1